MRFRTKHMMEYHFSREPDADQADSDVTWKKIKQMYQTTNEVLALLFYGKWS